MELVVHNAAGRQAFPLQSSDSAAMTLFRNLVLVFLNFAFYILDSCDVNIL